jgi:hypothetical protein
MNHKIKNMQHLLEEKNALKEKQQMLLEKMHIQWQEIKQQMNPLTIAKNTLGKVFEKNQVETSYSENEIKNSFTFGMGMLAENLLHKLASKIKNIFKR